MLLVHHTQLVPLLVLFLSYTVVNGMHRTERKRELVKYILIEQYTLISPKALSAINEARV